MKARAGRASYVDPFLVTGVGPEGSPARIFINAN